MLALQLALHEQLTKEARPTRTYVKGEFSPSIVVYSLKTLTALNATGLKCRWTLHSLAINEPLGSNSAQFSTQMLSLNQIIKDTLALRNH